MPADHPKKKWVRRGREHSESSGTEAPKEANFDGNESGEHQQPRRPLEFRVSQNGPNMKTSGRQDSFFGGASVFTYLFLLVTLWFCISPLYKHYRSKLQGGKSKVSGLLPTPEVVTEDGKGPVDLGSLSRSLDIAMSCTLAVVVIGSLYQISKANEKIRREEAALVTYWKGICAVFSAVGVLFLFYGSSLLEGMATYIESGAEGRKESFFFTRSGNSLPRSTEQQKMEQGLFTSLEGKGFAGLFLLVVLCTQLNLKSFAAILRSFYPSNVRAGSVFPASSFGRLPSAKSILPSTRLRQRPPAAFHTAPLSSFVDPMRAQNSRQLRSPKLETSTVKWNLPERQLPANRPPSQRLQTAQPDQRTGPNNFFKQETRPTHTWTALKNTDLAPKRPVKLVIPDANVHVPLNPFLNIQDAEPRLGQGTMQNSYR